MMYTVTIPNYTPPLCNQWRGKHWSAARKLKTELVNLLGWYAKDVPFPKGRRAVLLRVWGWPKGRTPDLDSFDKLVLDSLVTSGLLLDDSATGLEGRMLVEITRSKERKTEIVLEDC